MTAVAIAVACCGCETKTELPGAAEIEAELRKDPGRGGKVGQMVGFAISQQAVRVARDRAEAVDPRCGLPRAPGERWIAELTLERRRGEALISSWTETRTLDETSDAAALRSSATFLTEVGGRGTRATEWRVTPEGTFVSTPGRDGDLWMRRIAEEDERQRVTRLADGMLQALIEGVGGWTRDREGWTLGDGELRCGPPPHSRQFIDRFSAGAVPHEATLRTGNEGRELRARWVLADGSMLDATYVDRVVAGPGGALDAPPEDRVVPTDRDRSLARAEALLTKLASAGLAEVASRPEDSRTETP